ncbi:MAG: ankyrin repeat domain-containing protein, partial [Proteobacteria bacterium]|nr:ankyrin repeat domain-containing protein [Pseudomonadota bacterium]
MKTLRKSLSASLIFLEERSSCLRQIDFFEGETPTALKKSFSTPRLSEEEQKRLLNQKLADSIESRLVFLSLHYIYLGADADTQDQNGSTLLHVVLDESDDYELNEEEVKLSTQVRLSDLIEVENNKINCLNIVNYLVDTHKVKLLQDIDGNTPLHYFARASFNSLEKDKVEQIARLLTKNQSKKAINVHNKENVSAWMLSVLYNCILQSLSLVKIAAVEINCVLEKTFGYDFSWDRTPEIEKRMKELFGDDSMFSFGWTDLMVICLFQNYNILESILQRDDIKYINDDYIVSDIPVMLREILNGENPLHYAVVFDDLELFKFLLKKMGPAWLLQVNCQGHTPLHKAAHVKSHMILQLLLNIDGIKDLLAPNWNLTEKFYEDFVNYESMQGRAGDCYTHWMCNRDLRMEEDYKAFVDCKYYRISDCGRSGDSLIHLLANEGYGDLLSLAATRSDVNFSLKNGSGYTPLRAAFESSEPGSLKVIGILASLAESREDINPNTYERYYYNIRERLMVCEEDVFWEFQIENLNIEELLDVYLSGKEFVSKGIFTKPEASVSLSSKEISCKKDSDLKNKIERCLSHYFTCMEFESFLDYIDLAPELASFYESLVLAYESRVYRSEDREDCFSVDFGEGVIQVVVTVDYIETPWPIRITYEALVSVMGREWDYANKLEKTENDKLLDKKYIFDYPQVPLLYLSIERILEDYPNGVVTDQGNPYWQKFIKFLQFPHIENLTIRLGDELKTLEQYAVGDVKACLLIKINIQDFRVEFAS